MEGDDDNLVLPSLNENENNNYAESITGTDVEDGGILRTSNKSYNLRKRVDRANRLRREISKLFQTLGLYMQQNIVEEKKEDPIDLKEIDFSNESSIKQYPMPNWTKIDANFRSTYAGIHEAIIHISNSLSKGYTIEEQSCKHALSDFCQHLIDLFIPTQASTVASVFETCLDIGDPLFKIATLHSLELFIPRLFKQSKQMNIFEEVIQCFDPMFKKCVSLTSDDNDNVSKKAHHLVFLLVSLGYTPTKENTPSRLAHSIYPIFKNIDKFDDGMNATIASLNKIAMKAEEILQIHTDENKPDVRLQRLLKMQPNDGHRGHSSSSGNVQPRPSGANPAGGGGGGGRSGGSGAIGVAVGVQPAQARSSIGPTSNLQKSSMLPNSPSSIQRSQTHNVSTSSRGLKQQNPENNVGFVGPSETHLSVTSIDMGQQNWESVRNFNDETPKLGDENAEKKEKESEEKKLRKAMIERADTYENMIDRVEQKEKMGNFQSIDNNENQGGIDMTRYSDHMLNTKMKSNLQLGSDNPKNNTHENNQPSTPEFDIPPMEMDNGNDNDNDNDDMMDPIQSQPKLPPISPKGGKGGKNTFMANDEMKPNVSPVINPNKSGVMGLLDQRSDAMKQQAADMQAHGRKMTFGTTIHKENEHQDPGLIPTYESDEDDMDNDNDEKVKSPKSPSTNQNKQTQKVKTGSPVAAAADDEEEYESSVVRKGSDPYNSKPPSPSISIRGGAAYGMMPSAQQKFFQVISFFLFFFFFFCLVLLLCVVYRKH